MSTDNGLRQFHRCMNTTGSVPLGLYSMANNYRKGDELQAASDLTSVIDNLMFMNNGIARFLSKAAPLVQFVAQVQTAREELNRTNKLSNQSIIDLTMSVVALAALGLTGGAALAVGSIGIGVGILSLLQDKHSWNDGAAIWDAEGTAVFDAVIGMYTDNARYDVFAQQEAIAVAQLLKNMDASIDNARIEAIFDAAAVSNTSPEAVLNMVGDVLGIGHRVSNGDSDALYRRLQSINGRIFKDSSVAEPHLVTPYRNLEIVDTASLANAAQDNSKQGYAYRYALVNLNPIAITGNASLYDKHNQDGELDADNFSEQILSDRADMLDLYIERNISDDSETQILASDANRVYQDLALDKRVSSFDTGGDYDNTLSKVIFGTQDDDLLYGGNIEDHIYGLGGNDELIGGAGTDYIEGNDGNDILDGGLGADSMYGGEGNDVYHIDEKKDVIGEEKKSGIDSIKTTISYSLPAHFENLQAIGFDAIDLAGNDGVNVIVGNDQDNKITGFSGNDYLFGGDGKDILKGGDGSDILEGGSGYDIYYADDFDWIDDRDGRGHILLNGYRLGGGITLCGPEFRSNMFMGGAGNVYQYEADSSTLIVNGNLIIQGFQNGCFGIDLEVVNLDDSLKAMMWNQPLMHYKMSVECAQNRFSSMRRSDEIAAAIAAFDSEYYEVNATPIRILSPEGVLVVVPEIFDKS